MLSSEHEVEWNRLTICNPHLYLNYELFFVGHFDNDNVLPEIETILQPLSSQVTDDLTDSFSKLDKAVPIKTKAVKWIEFMPKHQAKIPMEMGNMT